MKRGLAILVAVLFILISVIAYYQIFGSTKKLERYYTGIGVQLWKVDQNINGFGGQRNGQSMWFKNDIGQFTGKTFLGQVLKNGPAGKAGLESADMLLAVDDEDVSIFGVEGVIQKITNKRVGDRVNLKIRQTDESGNVLRDFNVGLIMEEIDRADWAPLDLELGGAFCTGNECIKYTAKVSEDKNSGKFTYHFGFSNTHNQSIIIKSQLFNLIGGKDLSDSTGSLLMLKQGENRQFIVETEDFPVSESPAPIREFVGADENPDMLDYFKKNYPDFSSREHYYNDANGKLWLNTAGTTEHFFVPSGWYNTLQKANEEFWRR